MTMKKRIAWVHIAFFLVGIAMLALHVGLKATAQNAKTGVILEINGPIGPAISDYFERELRNANAAGADIIIVEMDTPGGLDDSMRQIIQAILASPTPVATYVTPSGARAASAGLYILYASHIAAMTPGTNTGAATPVSVGGGPPVPEPGGNPLEEPAEEPAAPADDAGTDETAAEEAVAEDGEAATEDETPGAAPALGNEDAMRAKVVNDASAYIRSLAELRGRNAEWGEAAVRDAASLAAKEALDLNVIDIVAEDIQDLLVQMNGRTVKVKNEDVVLDTENVSLERVVPDAITRFLAFISNPNVALIFMSIGAYGIIIEMWNPGSIFPGALGAISLIIGLYSFQVLPVNWAFAAVMGLGIILVVVEAFTPTFGLVGLAGLLLFGSGAYLLFPGGVPGFEVSLLVIGLITSVGGLFLGAVMFAIARTHGRGPVIGAEAIKRREGRVDNWDNEKGEGHVIVEGERWRARSSRPLDEGDAIKVTEVDGLVLVVKPA